MTVPVLPTSTKRAIDDWLARGYRVVIEADGTLTVTPGSTSTINDLDFIDFKKKRK